MRTVVGYDGSDHAKRALERAALLAAGDPVIVVSVLQVSGPAARGPAQVSQAAVEVNHEHLREAATLLSGHGVQAELVDTIGNAIGDTADALIDVATQHHADVIVVGTRGLGGLKRLVLGSVSAKLAHQAPCDVLVVR